MIASTKAWRCSAAMILSLSLVSISQAAVTVNYNTVLFTHNQYYHGLNFGGFFTDRGDIPTAGVINELKQAGVQILRFPAGASGDDYSWKTATAQNALTPLEAWNIIHQVGAKALFQTNTLGRNGTAAGGSASYAADWVTYCESNNIDVLAWDIGNEPELALGTTATLLQPYYNTFKAQADSMHARKAGIKIMGPVFANDYYWKTLNLLQQFMAECSTKADYVSLHWYQNTGALGGWETLKSEALQWPALMTFIRTKTAKPLYITEWSVLGPGLNNVQNDWNKTLGAALSYADVIGTFAKTGVAGYTMFGTIYQVESSWGIICSAVDYNIRDYPNPSYFSLALWGRMGNMVVSNTCTNAAGYAVYSHKKADGTAQVLLLNKTGASRSETVSFSGYDPTNKQVGIYELKGTTVDSAAFDIVYNSVTNPMPTSGALPAPKMQTCAGSSFTITLSPYSATMLYFGYAGDYTTRISSNVPAGEHTFSTIRIIPTKGRRMMVVLPNDMTDKLSRIHMYTASGSWVKSISVSQNSSGNCYFDAGRLASGTYIVKVETAGRIYMEKVNALK